MDKLRIRVFWIIPFCTLLLNASCVHTIFLKFTNITCEAKFKNVTVAYCHIGQVDRQTNYMTMRYNMVDPMPTGVFFNSRLMIRSSNGWKPFLYAIEIDACRVWKPRYNALAKLLFGLMDGHTNLNHTCPYNDNYFEIDRLMNTDVSKKLKGIPMGKGHYALFTSWLWKNATRSVTSIYIEVLSV